jgi:hypothetical protein
VARSLSASRGPTCVDRWGRIRNAPRRHGLANGSSGHGRCPRVYRTNDEEDAALTSGWSLLLVVFFGSVLLIGSEAETISLARTSGASRSGAAVYVGGRSPNWTKIEIGMHSASKRVVQRQRLTKNLAQPTKNAIRRAPNQFHSRANHGNAISFGLTTSKRRSTRRRLTA